MKFWKNSLRVSLEVHYKGIKATMEELSVCLPRVLEERLLSRLPKGKVTFPVD